MLKRFQKKRIQNKIELNLKNRDISNLNDSVVTMGYLVDEDMFQNFEKLFEVSKEMGLKDKNVKIFTFMNVKKKLPSLRQNQINNKEFSWKGIIQNQNANEFLELPFDILIGFYQEKNDYLDLMMTKSKAKFKVGFEGGDCRVSDLIIDVDPLKTNDFKRELIKYLRVLNKIS
ncbi:MAG: hypothetical protein L3J09_10580 [Flavobacteriaceae bacterium]|nr:hypothetical protein [Flavobacteriaceae bacterium]